MEEDSRFRQDEEKQEPKQGQEEQEEQDMPGAALNRFFAFYDRMDEEEDDAGEEPDNETLSAASVPAANDDETEKEPGSDETKEGEEGEWEGKDQQFGRANKPSSVLRRRDMPVLSHEDEGLAVSLSHGEQVEDELLKNREEREAGLDSEAETTADVDDRGLSDIREYWDKKKKADEREAVLRARHAPKPDSYEIPAPVRQLETIGHADHDDIPAGLEMDQPAAADAMHVDEWLHGHQNKDVISTEYHGHDASRRLRINGARLTKSENPFDVSSGVQDKEAIVRRFYHRASRTASGPADGSGLDRSQPDGRATMGISQTSECRAPSSRGHAMMDSPSMSSIRGEGRYPYNPNLRIPAHGDTTGSEAFVTPGQWADRIMPGESHDRLTSDGRTVGRTITDSPGIALQHGTGQDLRSLGRRIPEHGDTTGREAFAPPTQAGLSNQGQRTDKNRAGTDKALTGEPISAHAREKGIGHTVSSGRSGSSDRIMLSLDSPSMSSIRGEGRYPYNPNLRIPAHGDTTGSEAFVTPGQWADRIMPGESHDRLTPDGRTDGRTITDSPGIALQHGTGQDLRSLGRRIPEHGDTTGREAFAPSTQAGLSNQGQRTDKNRAGTDKALTGKPISAHAQEKGIGHTVSSGRSGSSDRIMLSRGQGAAKGPMPGHAGRVVLARGADGHSVGDLAARTGRGIRLSRHALQAAYGAGILTAGIGRISGQPGIRSTLERQEQGALDDGNILQQGVAYAPTGRDTIRVRSRGGGRGQRGSVNANGAERPSFGASLRAGSMRHAAIRLSRHAAGRAQHTVQAGKDVRRQGAAPRTGSAAPRASHIRVQGHALSGGRKWTGLRVSGHPVLDTASSAVQEQTLAENRQGDDSGENRSQSEEKNAPQQAGLSAAVRAGMSGVQFGDQALPGITTAESAYQAARSELDRKERICKADQTSRKEAEQEAQAYRSRNGAIRLSHGHTDEMSMESGLYIPGQERRKKERMSRFSRPDRPGRDSRAHVGRGRTVKGSGPLASQAEAARKYQGLFMRFRAHQAAAASPAAPGAALAGQAPAAKPVVKIARAVAKKAVAGILSGSVLFGALFGGGAATGLRGGQKERSEWNPVQARFSTDPTKAALVYQPIQDTSAGQNNANAGEGTATGSTSGGKAKTPDSMTQYFTEQLKQRQQAYEDMITTGYSADGSSAYVDGTGTPVAAQNCIFVGDSRTVMMHEAVGETGVTWEAKDSMGLSWMKKTGVPAIDAHVGNGTAVVILMGVNDVADTWQTKNYASYINQKAREWAGRGAQTYYVSILPVDDAKDHYESNSQIEAWNASIRPLLSQNVTYVDLYGQLKGHVSTASDGLHYQNQTSRTIYNMIMSSLKTGTASSSAAGTGNSDEDTTAEHHISVMDFLASCKRVTDIARLGHYKYGNSQAVNPTTDHLISCDRLVAKALYDLGMTDQRRGGETCGSMDVWLSRHGFLRSTSLSAVRTGSILLVKHHNKNYTSHMYVAASPLVRDRNGRWHGDRYDCGQQKYIDNVQPIRDVGYWYRTDSVIVYNFPSSGVIANGKAVYGEAAENLADIPIRSVTVDGQAVSKNGLTLKTVGSYSENYTYSGTITKNVYDDQGNFLRSYDVPSYHTEPIYVSSVNVQWEYDDRNGNPIASVGGGGITASGSAGDILRIAAARVGGSYYMGGNRWGKGPSDTTVDCSHYVWHVMMDAGVYHGEYRTSQEWLSVGRPVASLAAAQAGDVIIYPGHVAIYDGNGMIYEAKGHKWGITHDRKAAHGHINGIRRLIADGVSYTSGGTAGGTVSTGTGGTLPGQSSTVSSGTAGSGSTQMDIVLNIIGGVESGDQVYGRRNYAAYDAPFKNAPTELTCTTGWPQFYGDEAQKYYTTLFQQNPTECAQIDSTGAIRRMLGTNWVNARWNPSESEKQTLIRLEMTEAGKTLQDKQAASQMAAYIRSCCKKYTQDLGACIFYAEVAHLGGERTAIRTFNSCGGNYSWAQIYSVLTDGSYSKHTSVDAPMFRSRHTCVYNWIRQHVTPGTKVDLDSLMQFGGSSDEDTALQDAGNAQVFFFRELLSMSAAGGYYADPINVSDYDKYGFDLLDWAVSGFIGADVNYSVTMGDGYVVWDEDGQTAYDYQRSLSCTVTLHVCTDLYLLEKHDPNFGNSWSLDADTEHGDPWPYSYMQLPQDTFCMLFNVHFTGSGFYGGGGSLTNVALKIYQFFHAKGVDDLHIAALLGNMAQESGGQTIEGINPALVESNGEGIGIIQWSFERKRRLISYAAQQGTTWQDLNAQLSFMWLELQSAGYWRSFLTVSDIGEATKYYCMYGEAGGPSTYAAHSFWHTEDVRIPQAKRAFAMMQSGAMSANTGSAGTSQVVTGGMRSLGKWNLTAYADTPEDQGPYVGRTASGAKLTAGRTIAMNVSDIRANNLHFGDKIMINGHIYTLEDTGPLARHGIDIFVASPSLEYQEQYNLKGVEVFLVNGSTT